jgi:hypothetical protein
MRVCVSICFLSICSSNNKNIRHTHPHPFKKYICHKTKQKEKLAMATRKTKKAAEARSQALLVREPITHADLQAWYLRSLQHFGFQVVLACAYKRTEVVEDYKNDLSDLLEYILAKKKETPEDSDQHTDLLIQQQNVEYLTSHLEKDLYASKEEALATKMQKLSLDPLRVQDVPAAWKVGVEEVGAAHLTKTFVQLQQWYLDVFHHFAVVLLCDAYGNTRHVKRYIRSIARLEEALKARFLTLQKEGEKEAPSTLLDLRIMHQNLQVLREHMKNDFQ